MSYFSNETQVTQSGQAIKINALALQSLSQFYETNLGPNGTEKMLITPSGGIKTTKDGSVLCKEIQFSHPSALILNRLTASLATEVGDGCSSFVILTCKTFLNAFKYYNEGCSIHKILESFEEAKKDLMGALKSKMLPVDADILEKITYCGLVTKMESILAKQFSKIIVGALKNIEGTEFFDANMIEVIKVKGGFANDSRLVNGLVLDHGNRNPNMPTQLENCAILITNISLEYEKPEIHSSFHYNTADQREIMAEREREHITKRAIAIAEFGKKIKKERNMNLVVISEKGIDPFSLEILANENILALRRAKRRNLERLIKMCQGNIVNRLEELDVKNLGFCQKVTVESFQDEKYTYMEGTPVQGSCTILVRGDNDIEMDRNLSVVKSCLKSVSIALKDKIYIKGGIELYYEMSKIMETKSKSSKLSVGYKILRESYYDMIKVLIRNMGKNIEEEINKLERGEYSYDAVYDNFAVISRVFMNSCTSAMNFMMIDEIIKAGKPIKEENQQPGN